MKQVFSNTNPNTFLIMGLAMWASVALRWTLEFAEQHHPLRWLLNTILIAYAILMIFNEAIIGSMLLYFELNFFALFFLTLGGRAMFLFPRKIPETT